MTTVGVEVVLQAARERIPGATPRIISDNGPQFIAKDFKEFIRLCTMTHVRTSPFYPQSNGKLERLTKSLKGECIRPNSPVSLSDARCLVATYVEHYNTVRLHSAIGYVTPQAKLEGREGAIFAERQCRLAQARAARLIWPIGPSTRAWPYETGPDEHTAHRAAQLQGNPLDLAHGAGQAGVSKISSLTGGGCPVLITLCS